MNNTVFITGASSDIGIALIKEIASPDLTIIAHYNNSIEKIDKLKNQISGNIIPLKADLSNDAELKMLISTLTDKYSEISKIVHLASPKIELLTFKQSKWPEFEKIYSVQIKSIVLILQALIPFMIKMKYGKIVFMLSSNTIGLPANGYSAYTSVKYSLLGLMKSLAVEYGSHNLNFNAVSPSMLDNDFNKNLPGSIKEKLRLSSPLKRFASTEDIVPVIKFLLSQESNFLNGVNIPACAGSVM